MWFSAHLQKYTFWLFIYLINIYVNYSDINLYIYVNNVFYIKSIFHIALIQKILIFNCYLLVIINEKPWKEIRILIFQKTRTFSLFEAMRGWFKEKMVFKTCSNMIHTFNVLLFKQSMVKALLAFFFFFIVKWPIKNFIFSYLTRFLALILYDIF